MKKFYKISLILIILFYLLGYGFGTQAVTNLKSVSLDIAPKNASSNSTWTISFSIPNDTKLGHLLVSLSGYKPDLTNAVFSITGLPAGTAKIGKSNPNCVSNCDDVRFYLAEPVSVSAGTNIVINLTGVKNSENEGKTGVGYIQVFSSKYPDDELAFSSGETFLNLDPADPNAADNLIPGSVTDESLPEDIREVLINQLFYQEGAKTTKLIEIENPQRVENFTLDLLEKIKIEFQKPLDFSTDKSIEYIANLADHMTFNYLFIWIDEEVMKHFDSPILVTFYDVPYVWEPDILINEQDFIAVEDLKNFKSLIVDDASEISFLIEEAGQYRLVPHLELYVDDDQVFEQKNNQVEFSGRISDPTAVVKLVLNGQDYSDFKYLIDQETGEFTFTIEMQEGTNLLQLDAQSQFGQVNKVSAKVNLELIDENGAPIDDQRADYLNPLYYVAGFLGFCLIVLIILVIVLVKKRKK